MGVREAVVGQIKYRMAELLKADIDDCQADEEYAELKSELDWLEKASEGGGQ